VGGASIRICHADDEAACLVTNADDPFSLDGPCDEGALAFSIGRVVTTGGVFTVSNANGWNVETYTHGNPIANASVNQLPYDTDVTVGGGGPVDYEITFSVAEATDEITIVGLTRIAD